MNTQSESEDNESPNPQNEHKNIRHRKRKFYNSIREQMEFYFGDANLLKDRFLMQLIKKDPFVPLEIFLKFNRMKKLVNCIDDIGKSISNSKILELNDNKTKVCRISELPDNQNNDSDIRTIYVEGIPATADHDSLKKIFSHISGGKVVYVSLPKYKKSRKIKEFGFIEFENELCVEKCLKAFQLFDGVLGTQQNLDPSELTSIKTFIREQNDEIDNNSEKNQKDHLNLCNDEIQKKHSSQSESDSLDSFTGTPIKRPKLLTNTMNENTVDGKNINLQDDIKCDNSTEENNKSDNINDTTTNVEGTTESKNVVKVIRKRKKKLHKSIKKECLNIDLNIQQLKILQKKEWKRLRNKYLNMQREAIAALKRKNWEKNCGQQQQNNNLKSKNINLSSKPKQSSLIPQTSTKTNEVKQFEIIKSPHHMNFYMVNKEIDGNTDDDDNNDKLKKSNQDVITKNKKSNENLTLINKNTMKTTDPIRNLAHEKSPLFNYESGIIVNIRFLEPCLDLKTFKADMKQYDYVKYIDVKEGALEAQIRCDSNKMAQQLCQKIQSPEYNCKILSGDVEKLYWAKIMQDREMKLNKTIKIKNKRGREKIPKIIANHIRFGDDE